MDFFDIIAHIAMGLIYIVVALIVISVIIVILKEGHFMLGLCLLSWGLVFIGSKK